MPYLALAVLSGLLIICTKWKRSWRKQWAGYFSTFGLLLSKKNEEEGEEDKDKHIFHPFLIISSSHSFLGYLEINISELLLEYKRLWKEMRSV